MVLAQKADMVCIGNKRLSIIGRNRRGEDDKNMDLGKEIDAICMICVLESCRHPKKEKGMVKPPYLLSFKQKTYLPFTPVGAWNEPLM